MIVGADEAFEVGKGAPRHPAQEVLLLGAERFQAFQSETEESKGEGNHAEN